MKWFWSVVIPLSVIATGLANFIFPNLVIRPFIMIWFLCVCPGMVFIRFFRLKEPAIEWTLAIALSFVIDAAVGSIQLYSGNWSPSTTLLIIMGICIVGVILQSLQIGFQKL